MLKKITSPTAVSALLLLAGATAIPAGIANDIEILQMGIGVFTLGVVSALFQYLFKVWRWEHFLRIRAMGRGWLFLLMNTATVALFPAAALYLRIIGAMYPERYGHSDALGLALIGAWTLNLFTLIATNVMFLVALPHTTLPARMAMRCARRSKELNTWRVVLALLLLADIVFLAISVSVGAVMSIVAAAVYMYVIFSLHAGKIAWKEGVR
ncbi:MAG: hypothetical protein IJZ22_03630 [Bacteroidaceae bacterium]|nr:hypothetical protein [Bacteroidaceae bacterium]